MAKLTSKHSNPLSVRLLCLWMAGLTACSTTRSQYVWHDAGTQKTAATKPAQILDNWGAKPEGQEVMDPELAPGYLLSLNCPADSKLNGDYRVEFNGNLELPYDVSVNTTGMTVTQLKKKLADLYRPYFKTPSEIAVRVKERRYWVEARGLVEKPGRYLLEPESSLDMLIGMAGGVSKATPPVYVRIQKGQKVFIFDLSQYYSHGEERAEILGWLGGEVVFFQKELSGPLTERSPSSSYRLPVFMTGEIRKPGEYLLNPNSDFVDSLVQAGGFTERADLDNIEVIRRTGKRNRVYNFAWNEFQRAPAPQPGDVVFVHADKITKAERRTTLFATIISALAAITTSAILVLAYDKGGLGTTR